MIQRVYEQACKCKWLSDVIVATDDQRIHDCVSAFGGKAEMTSSDHSNGTERCVEIAEKFPADYYINVQGDEPFIHPEQITSLAEILDGETEIGTLVKVIDQPEVLDDPSKMKVVLNHDMEAMYFSRSAIPFVRDHKKEKWLSQTTFYKHIGIYAYRSDILKIITDLPTGNLEKAESLEQLRWLEYGYRIRVATTEHESLGIDTPEDLEVARRLTDD